MSAIDIVIVVFALALAAIGWERGAVASAVPLTGFIAGIAIGARLAPTVLEDGSHSAYAPAVAAAGGILLGLFLAIALDGFGTGLSDRLVASRGSRLSNSVAGAALLAVLALAFAWVFGAVALNAPGNSIKDLRQAVQRSKILAALNDAFPPSGPLLHALRRIDPSSRVHGPDADVRKPDSGVVNDPRVAAASGSTLRVVGSACGLGLEGSGWIGARGLVVTNAHVVAGEDDTTVMLDGGAELDAQAVHIDPRNDLALLSVPGLDGPVLPLVDSPQKGTAAAIAGYPEGGPLTIEPARLGRQGKVRSQDAYGRGPVERRMVAFRGTVRNGNSGGPVIDRRGRVLTTVFAASLGAGPPSGLGVPNSITARALAGKLAPVDTGACAP